MKHTIISFLNGKLKQNTASQYIIRAFVIFAVLLTIILTLVWNTSLLNSVLQRSTKEYVEDVSKRLASDVSYRLTSFSLYIEAIADSLGRMPDFGETEDYLDRKAGALGFDSIIILDKDGTVIPKGFYCEHFDEWKKESVNYYDKTRVTYIDGHKILFTSPIFKNGVADQLLIGMYENKSMQQLIQSVGFSGQGFSCITDQDGKLVVAPTDSKPFLRINDIINQGSNDKEIIAVNNMVEDIKNHRSGILYFTSTQGQPSIMSYCFLNVNDWVLLAIVPQDLIIKGSDAYVQRTFAIIGGISVIFFIILVNIAYSSRKNRNDLEQTAFTDPLTGGINQAAFQIKCGQLLAHKPPSSHTIVFINVKGFKHINENFGTEAGNETLKFIYTTLEKHLKNGELVTRSETDHFSLCLHENDEAVIRNRLKKMTDEIACFNHREQIHYTINLVQGVYIVDDPGLDIRIIQGRARAACRYQPGEEACSFYNNELIAKINQEMELNGLFDDSIRNHDFQVYLQPKVCLTDQTLGGAEALVRWIHPERGVIYPSDFIPLFESNGKICALDLYIFEEVCRLLCRWADEKKPLIPVSVNLSRVHMRDPGFLKAFVELKEKYKIPDGLIELEMLESVFFDAQQLNLVKNVIKDLHEHGFLCSLDDFGFGYSSLALLKEFDVDTIKLDRQFFVDSMNEKSWKIISSFVKLADELNISVVAEGIETEEQLASLRAINCEMVQGYIYSKPLSIDSFERWADSFTQNQGTH